VLVRWENINHISKHTASSARCNSKTETDPKSIRHERIKSNSNPEVRTPKEWYSNATSTGDSLRLFSNTGTSVVRISCGSLLDTLDIGGRYIQAEGLALFYINSLHALIVGKCCSSQRKEVRATGDLPENNPPPEACHVNFLFITSLLQPEQQVFGDRDTTIVWSPMQ